MIKWKLKDALWLKRLTQSEAARRMGVARQTMNKWTNAPTMPPMDDKRLNALCKALDLSSVAELIEYEPDEET